MTMQECIDTVATLCPDTTFKIGIEHWHHVGSAGHFPPHDEVECLISAWIPNCVHFTGKTFKMCVEKLKEALKLTKQELPIIEGSDD